MTKVTIQLRHLGRHRQVRPCRSWQHWLPSQSYKCHNHNGRHVLNVSADSNCAGGFLSVSKGLLLTLKLSLSPLPLHITATCPPFPWSYCDLFTPLHFPPIHISCNRQEMYIKNAHSLCIKCHFAATNRFWCCTILQPSCITTPSIASLWKHKQTWCFVLPWQHKQNGWHSMTLPLQPLKKFKKLKIGSFLIWSQK